MGHTLLSQFICLSGSTFLKAAALCMTELLMQLHLSKRSFKEILACLLKTLPHLTVIFLNWMGGTVRIIKEEVNDSKIF